MEGLIADLPSPGATSFTRQQAPLGLGHAVWCAREVIGDEPFAVMLPDMITLPGANGDRCLQQCVETYRRVWRQCHRRRGSPAGGDPSIWHRRQGRGTRATFEITGMVEKPPQGNRTLELHHFGPLYPATARFSTCSANGQKGAGGEIQLTDSMIELAKTQNFFGRSFDGKTYDTGSKIGFLAANVAFALSRPDIEPGFRAELKRIVGSL